mmetsp:Transcript_9180/g.24069  ORF Transcript_9180/g.24069 Transcript_9180/m.24069 type:complete len:219 (+) Transcript_9180:817-1473(+)
MAPTRPPAISEPVTTTTAMPSVIVRSSTSTERSCAGNLPKVGRERIQLREPATWLHREGTPGSMHEEACGPRLPSMVLRPTRTYCSGCSGCAARSSESSMASKQYLGARLRGKPHTVMGLTAEMRLILSCSVVQLSDSTISTDWRAIDGYICAGATPTAITGILHSLRSRPAPSWSCTVARPSLGICSSTRAAGDWPLASNRGLTCTLEDMPMDPSLK